MQIRQAVSADVPWLLQELAAFDRFYAAKHSLVPPDPAVAAATVAGLIAEHPFFIAIDDATNVPIGFIAGALVPHLFHPELRTLAELLWWVVPERRGSSAGGRLLAHFEAYGRAHADWIVLTLDVNSPIHPATLERRGFSPHERSFLLEV